MTAARPTAADVAVDELVIDDWLHQLYGNVDEGWLTLFSIDRTSGRERTDWSPIDDYDQLTANAARRAGTGCVWFGVGTRKAHLLRGRGGSEDIGYLPGLVADLDVAGPAHKTTHTLPPTVDDALRLLDDFPLRPTAIVHSGHGLQPYWLFDEPAAAQEVAPVLERWGHTWEQLAGHHGWHVDNVFDLARIMRLPGTWNRKAEPVPVTILEADWTRRYGLTELDENLRDTPAPPPRQKRPARAPGSPLRPGDAFNHAHSPADVLQDAGWQHHHTDRNGDQHWTRPGKERREGHSATIYAGDGGLIIWTDAIPGLKVKTHRYDAFGIYTDLHHGGDHKAAAAQLEGQGYGIKRSDDLTEQLGGRAPTGTSGQADEPGVIDPDGADVDSHRLCPGRLPADFWDARPVLAHIRQAAHSRMISADALLHVTLARVASQTPHTLLLPPTVGKPASLGYFTCVISESGIGKSSANGVAAELLPAPEWVLDQIPPGSGEGLAELLFEFVDEMGPDGKVAKVKRQTRHNAYVYADEGQSVAEMGNRKGSTLLSSIRSMWNSDVLGQANASAERDRRVQPLTYVFGMTISLQDKKAGALLDDTDGGTPQRFSWAWADDYLPDDDPPWPGPIDWAPPARIEGQYFGLHADIRAEVRAAHKAKMRRQVTVDPLDTHTNLFRLKVAGLLAVLDKRADINLEDWALAGVVREASNGVRSAVIATVARDAAQRRRDAAELLAERELTVDSRRQGQAVLECAQKVQTKVIAKPGLTVAELRRKLTARLRDVLDDGLALAIEQGLVVERTTPGVRGGDRRELHPGKAR